VADCGPALAHRLVHLEVHFTGRPWYACAPARCLSCVQSQNDRQNVYSPSVWDMYLLVIDIISSLELYFFFNAWHYYVLIIDLVYPFKVEHFSRFIRVAGRMLISLAILITLSTCLHCCVPVCRIRRRGCLQTYPHMSSQSQTG